MKADPAFMDNGIFIAFLASALVFLAQLRIKEVWGTDRDLGIEGARVVPTGA